jgi:hypothetical protein
MLGGRIFRAGEGGIGEIGIANDSENNIEVGSYLGGLLPMVFGPSHWGSDSPEGRVKHMWTGVLAGTIDALPFVGKLESKITKRRAPRTISSIEMPHPGEWIAAGYNGDVMVNAWLSGVAVAIEVLGLDDMHFDAEPGIPSGKMSEWLPKEYIISSDRLSKASILGLATLL